MTESLIEIPEQEFPVFKMMGDSVINVYLASEISSNINDEVHYLAGLIKKQNWPGIKEIVPSYVSLSIHYDPFVVDYLSVAGFVKNILANNNEKTNSISKRIVVIPTLYDGDYGPDLDSVSSITGLSVEQIIKIHTNKEYKVYSIGFTPGFPYLGGLDNTLYCPRLDSPRINVPLGSVAIAELQTGIYPTESPGGWRLIGRTPVTLFDATRPVPSLLRPGDLVKFKPMTDKKEFEHIKERSDKNDYQVEEILV
jgi:KipI family sensor histidine kinase inhibitor